MRGSVSVIGVLLLALGSAGAVARDWDDEDDDARYSRREHRYSHRDSCDDDHGHGHGNGHGHGHGQARHYRHHGNHGNHGHRGHQGYAFAVPAVIHPEGAHAYVDYYRGRDWYGPHRHHHAVYSFPVASHEGWDYRPYAYCRGRLVEAYYVPERRPRFDVHVRF